MNKLSEQPVLDVAILTEMYGDDCAQTLCQVLSAFQSEAQGYVAQLQRAAMADDAAEIARLCHSLKSMAALIGASQLAIWCQTTEQAARQREQGLLLQCLQQFDPLWSDLLAQLHTSLHQHGHSDA